MEFSPTSLCDLISTYNNPGISPINTSNSQIYHANDTKMVHMNVSPSDHFDKWHSFTAAIPTNNSQLMIHLHAHTVMDYVSEQTIQRDTDLATTTVTAIPSTQATPAILIWQQHSPGLEAPKAGESVSRSRYPDTTHTQCHSDTPTPPHTDTKTPATQHTLLHEMLEPSTPTHECIMNVCMSMTEQCSMIFRHLYKAPPGDS
jgi:hypothetical protein